MFINLKNQKISIGMNTIKYLKLVYFNVEEKLQDESKTVNDTKFI